ncbi:E3 SUMO-protein ligase NSE2-like [Episyrphus balteatus]|uniref:E3 SUMO-protein ligase NSE2-like n=1 Tax=Episyrphus balteatus TaxID=286459 RepID=UPI002485CED2|nr:E3 SUMO-protein ligase NSE2-like [Episyrphus balteatus]
MAQLINTKVDEAIQSLIKTAELTAQYGGDEQKNPEIFGKILEQLIGVKNDVKKADKAFSTAKDKQSIAQFDQTFASEINKQPKSKAKNSDEYKRIMDEIRTLLSMNYEAVASTSVVEGDDYQMEMEISDIDPLTKRRMTHPVKNTVCGHYYEKSTILESIQVNPRLRCPIAGCGNNQFVQKAHLIEDPVFRMRLQRRNENEQN